jgi:AcrR family transcriptional regulator
MTVTCGDKRLEARHRSIDAIFDTLFHLLKSQPMDTITVSSIIKKSGVARSTFYRHFASVPDVVEGYFRFLDEKFDQEAGDKVDLRSREYLTKVFTVYKQIGDRMLICQNAGLGDRFLQAIVEYYIARIGDMPYRSTDRYELHYYAGAIFCVAREWIATGMAEAPEQVADIFLTSRLRPAKPAEQPNFPPHTQVNTAAARASAYAPTLARHCLT